MVRVLDRLFSKHTSARYGQHGLHSPRNEHIVMIRLPRHAKSVLIASVSLVTVLGLAQPAAAKGGPRPKPPVTQVPAPTPAPAPLDCFTDQAIVDRTTPDIAVNYAGDAGCVSVQVANGTLRLTSNILMRCGLSPAHAIFWII